jgi:hypothetical protein
MVVARQLRKLILKRFHYIKKGIIIFTLKQTNSNSSGKVDLTNI